MDVQIFHDLTNAVADSVKRTRIASVYVPREHVDMALAHLEALATHDDLEHDYVRDGQTIETWAYESDAPEGSMVWRVHLLADRG